MSRKKQVYIGFNGEKGQIMQVAYGDYLDYWSRIGWALLSPATELPLEIKGEGDGNGIARGAGIPGIPLSMFDVRGVIPGS